MTSSQQTWWVTGAGSGIGNALAERLAAAGHKVFVSSRSPEGLVALAARYPQTVHVAPVDVSDRAAMQGLFKQLPQPPQQLDGVILSAGICEYIDLPNLDAASIAKVMAVNFMGVVHACELALPLLQAAATANHRPKLIGIGSMSSYVGFPRAEGYGASKAAMAYFLDALRCDVQTTIDVSIVFPGFVATRLTAQNDFAMPFQWTADQAADYVFSRLWQGKRTLRFPWQLHCMLRVAQLFPSLWYGKVIPALTKNMARGH